MRRLMVVPIILAAVLLIAPAAQAATGWAPYQKTYVKWHTRVQRPGADGTVEDWILYLHRRKRAIHRARVAHRRWVAEVEAARAARMPSSVTASSSSPVTPPSGLATQAEAIAAIKSVFGSYATQALSVAACESGYRVWATNGQYFGLFQMGSSERAIYGGSSYDPTEQSRAAYAYFAATGYDWSPWQCRP